MLSEAIDNRTICDVLIIGGGPAGSAIAALLALPLLQVADAQARRTPSPPHEQSGRPAPHAQALKAAEASTTVPVPAAPASACQ